MNASNDELIDDLDTVDYALLKALHSADRPLWKQRLYEYIEEQQDRLPLDEMVCPCRPWAAGSTTCSRTSTRTISSSTPTTFHAA